MKTATASFPFLPLSVLALIAGLLWMAGPMRTEQAPAGAAIKSIRARPAPAIGPRRLEFTPYALIHEKLQQLLEIKTGDTDGPERLLRELRAELTDENAADIVMALSPEERDTAFGAAALARWLDADAPAAAEWIAQQPGATAEQAMLVAQKLLADPARLRAYCDDLPDGSWKQMILTNAGQGLVPVDPGEAIKLAGQMEPGAARKDLLETAAYEWMHRDAQAALAWINRLTDPELREQLSAVAGKAIAVTDPALAAEWLVTALTSAPIANEAMLSVVETWGDRDPASAAAWVGRLASQAAREAAVDIVVSHWLPADAGAALAWVQSLPDRDRVLDKLAAPEADEDAGT